MKVNAGEISIGNIINSVGNLNSAGRKVSSGYNFIQGIIGFIIVFGIGIFITMINSLIGIVILFFSLLLLFFTIAQKKRTNRFLKLEKELIDSLSNDEKISFIFTDIDSLGEISKGGNRFEKENVMILTDKRIIFLYIPRIDYNNFTSGNPLANLGANLSYNGLLEKVQSEIKDQGLNELIKISRIKYALNYNEISEIKIKNFSSSVRFKYRGKKFKYSIRRDQIDQFKEIFKKYIK